MSTLGEGATVGPYRVGRLLGRGGMAVVYEAEQASVGRTVALKFVAPDVTDPGFIERFRHEGRMQAALDHPHIVTVYEAGASDYGPYLAMRLVRGPTLAKLIDEGVLTSARTLDLIEQVAGALDAAHAAGLVHRDVKPRNVLVEETDHAYLADFGLTRSSDTEGVTGTGHFMGTIAYAAPEVISGGEPGPAADRYALAAVLFECLTGTTVFPRPSHAAVLYAHTHEPPPRVSGRREGIPKALDDVLIAGLAKDPAQRPQKAVDLATRARKALAGIELGPPAPRVLSDGDDGTTAGQVTLPSAVPVLQPRRRGRWIAALAAVLGIAFGAGVVALVDDGDSEGVRAVPLPSAPPGTIRIGATLAAPGRTVDCTGGAVTPSSPNCTIFQDRLPGTTTIVVPRDGVIRRWGVRSATGEMALAVIRERDGFFQIARSRNRIVPTRGPWFFPTDLTVEKGDRLALVVIGGSGVGIRPARQSTTSRILPILTGLAKPARPGASGELELRADLLPGAERRPALQLRGAAAAAAPAGKVIARAKNHFTNGKSVEVRLLEIDGRGALDTIIDGKRAGRITIDDLHAPVAPGAKIDMFIYPDAPQRMASYLTWSRESSDRLLHHYLEWHAVRWYLLN